MCGGRATLPGVVSLYSAAYLCSTESAFDEIYLCGFTTTSADVQMPVYTLSDMKRSRRQLTMTSSEGVSRVVKSETDSRCPMVRLDCLFMRKERKVEEKRQVDCSHDPGLGRRTWGKRKQSTDCNCVHTRLDGTTAFHPTAKTTLAVLVDSINTET